MTVKNKRFRVLVVCIFFSIIILIGVLIVFCGEMRAPKEVAVGFIMPGSCQESGWYEEHYQGIKNACDELSVKLLVKENVEEYSGKCETAIRELAQDGAQMIFLSSYGYASEVKDVVAEYPEIHFYANSSGDHASNLSSYFARIYQARYLAGIVAGMQTQNGRIGYVAAMPNHEVNRDMNAFTLGVRSVNPDAVVYVAWTGSWDDAQKEKYLTERLVADVHVDLVTYHQNQANVAATADEAGIQSIGYHKTAQGLSSAYLTAVVCDWENVYLGLIKEFLRGQGNAREEYWIGIDQDAVGLTEYSEMVSEETREKVEAARTRIIAGQDVFSEVIFDREGNMRCGENETIADVVLLEQMDWYVEGVEFYEE